MEVSLLGALVDEEAARPGWAPALHAENNAKPPNRAAQPSHGSFLSLRFLAY
jgi:hypothetical protein